MNELFKIYDTTQCRFHKDPENLLQLVFQIIAGYFENNCADKLTSEPVFTEILQKDRLTSQSTLSRFCNRMDETVLDQLEAISTRMRDTIYAIQHPEHLLFDLDSILLNTYGHQEGEAFNFHYRAHGYHPLLCFDSLTGDLLKTGSWSKPRHVVLRSKIRPIR